MEHWEPGLEGMHHNLRRRCPRCTSFNVIYDEKLGRIHCVECGYEGRAD